MVSLNRGSAALLNLFYFLVHLFVIHGLTIPFALIRYGRAGFLFGPLPSVGGVFPDGYGYGLGVVHCGWIGVVAMMYPACLWFGRLKQQRRNWWLGYL
jgi:hypothetical protein